MCLDLGVSGLIGGVLVSGLVGVECGSSSLTDLRGVGCFLSWFLEVFVTG